MERFHGCSLEECGQWWLKDVSSSCEKLKGNLENPIGLVKVPLGVCGPLLFDGEHVKGYILCPFASTEGALVASISRGATALTRSGGVYTKVLEQTQIRSPLFRLRSIQEVDLLTKWVSNKLEEMRSMVSALSISPHREISHLPHKFPQIHTQIRIDFCKADKITKVCTETLDPLLVTLLHTCNYYYSNSPVFAMC